MSYGCFWQMDLGVVLKSFDFLREKITKKTLHTVKILNVVLNVVFCDFSIHKNLCTKMRSKVLKIWTFSSQNLANVTMRKHILNWVAGARIDRQ